MTQPDDPLKTAREEACAAYWLKRYRKALRLLTPLAEQGDIESQLLMYRIYRYGQGRAPDMARASYWLEQAIAQAERTKKDERRRIPSSFPFSRVPGLSAESIDRLSQVRPETLGQAAFIEG